MKKIIAFLVVGVMIISSCVGCGTSSKSNGNRKKAVLNVSVFDGGYGTEYLESIAEAFEAEYTSVDVVIEKTNLFSEIKNQLAADRYVADVIVTITNYTDSGVKGKVLDITDVYDSYPYGEDGQKTIREKLAETADANNFEDKFYQIPVHSGSTGIVYNKVYLDAIYGEGKYELPVTTQQLIDMCKDIKAKNAWPFVYTNSVAAEYAVYLRDIFTAQYMGYDAFKAYYNLSYLDANGKEVKANSASEFNKSVEKARTSSYTVLNEIMSNKNGFVPESAASMNFTQAQAYFVGFTSQSDVKVVGGHKGAAFMVNGDWLYGEVEKYAMDVELDIRFMRTPVNSAIIDKLSTVNTEDQLVECIKYVDTVIDGTEGARPAYLSDEDYERLYEARRMVWTTHAQQVATIPANCTDEKIAKDFLRFIASDASALSYSSALQGLRSVFSDEIYDEAAEIEFTKSINQAFKKPLRVTNLNTVYSLYGTLPFYSNMYFVQNLYKCTNVNNSVKSMLAETEKEITNKWTKFVESYKE